MTEGSCAEAAVWAFSSQGNGSPGGQPAEQGMLSDTSVKLLSALICRTASKLPQDGFLSLTNQLAAGGKGRAARLCFKPAYRNPLQMACR